MVGLGRYPFPFVVLSSTTKDIMEDGINNQEAFEDMNKEELINLVLSMKAEKDNTSGVVVDDDT